MLTRRTGPSSASPSRSQVLSALTEETAWYAGDQWIVQRRQGLQRIIRARALDHAHVAPRAGFLLSLTKDSKTILKGGVGIFYDRVPLMIPVFEELPGRTATLLNPITQQAISSTSYRNQIVGDLKNPRSTAWNVELDRQLLANLLLRVSYEQRVTTKDFIVTPVVQGSSGIMSLSNGGSDTYKEFQVTGRYQIHRNFVNVSYVRSRAFGDLNEFNQFFGALAQPVVQPNAQGRLGFDAPNRFLAWGELAGPWKLTLVPVYEIHTGFPYSVQDAFRDYVGPRNVNRFRDSNRSISKRRDVIVPFREGSLRHAPGSAFSIFSTILIRATSRAIKLARILAGSTTTLGGNTAGNSFWSSKMRIYALLIFSVITTFGSKAITAQQTPPIDTKELVQRMLAHDAQRQASMEGYSGMRRYVLSNEKMHKCAEMTVRVKGESDGTKHFEVVSEDGGKRRKSMF